ncbi:hypothetical protein V8E54_008243 [Elaphomyces granulatus]
MSASRPLEGSVNLEWIAQPPAVATANEVFSSTTTIRYTLSKDLYHWNRPTLTIPSSEVYPLPSYFFRRQLTLGDRISRENNMFPQPHEWLVFKLELIPPEPSTPRPVGPLGLEWWPNIGTGFDYGSPAESPATSQPQHTGPPQWPITGFDNKVPRPERPPSQPVGPWQWPYISRFDDGFFASPLSEEHCAGHQRTLQLCRLYISDPGDYRLQISVFRGTQRFMHVWKELPPRWKGVYHGSHDESNLSKREASRKNEIIEQESPSSAN